jgi:hypothetical protein
VRSASPDRDITNNEDNDIDQVSAQPDLTLFKDAAVASSPVSNSVTITYVLSGGNIGNAIATSVTITDNLDSLVSYDSGSAVLSVNGQAPTAPAVSGSDPLIFGLPNLAPGDTYVLTYTVTVTDSIPAGTTAIANVAVIGGAEVDQRPQQQLRRDRAAHAAGRRSLHQEERHAGQRAGGRPDSVHPGLRQSRQHHRLYRHGRRATAAQHHLRGRDARLHARVTHQHGDRGQSHQSRRAAPACSHSRCRSAIRSRRCDCRSSTRRSSPRRKATPCRRTTPTARPRL